MPALLLLDLHESWAWVVVISNGLAGLWALGAHRWAALRSRLLWWFTGLAEVTMLVQVIFGVTLINRYEIEAPQFHMFYGFVALISIAIIYSYRGQLRHKQYLLYGFGSLFVMGLGIRAMVLGER